MLRSTVADLFLGNPPSGRISLASARAVHKNRSQLLIALLENECDRLKLWLNPLLDSKHGPLPSKMSVSEVSRNSAKSLYPH